MICECLEKKKISCYIIDIIMKYFEYFFIKYFYLELLKKIIGNRFIFRMLECLNRCLIIL